MTSTLKLDTPPRGLQRRNEAWPLPGRFDEPLGFEAGDANLYRYVGNSPTNFVDPTGEVPPLIIIGIGIGAFWGACSSPNIANAPAPGDPVYPDPGPGGCEPQNTLIGAAIGGAGGVAGRAACKLIRRNGDIIDLGGSGDPNAPTKPFPGSSGGTGQTSPCPNATSDPGHVFHGDPHAPGFQWDPRVPWKRPPQLAK
jgi:hypothetical protein